MSERVLKAPRLTAEDLPYFRVLKPGERRLCWGLTLKSEFDLSTLYGPNAPHRDHSMCSNLRCSECIFGKYSDRETAVRFVESLKIGDKCKIQEDDLLL